MSKNACTNTQPHERHDVIGGDVTRRYRKDETGRFVRVTKEDA